MFEMLSWVARESRYAVRLANAKERSVQARSAWLVAAVIVGAVAMTAGCHHESDGYTVPPGMPGPDAYVPCGATTCASLHATCGPIGDGCGGVVDCGACPDPEVCGGSAQFTCSDRSVVPRTCDEAGANCGQVADGCGGLTQSCGTCPTGETCGIGSAANQCATAPCTGLCLQQNACTNQTPTTITGTVTAPGHAAAPISAYPIRSTAR